MRIIEIGYVMTEATRYQFWGQGVYYSLLITYFHTFPCIKQILQDNEPHSSRLFNPHVRSIFLTEESKVIFHVVKKLGKIFPDNTIRSLR